MTHTDPVEQRPSIVRVPHPDVSLWQSAVREVVAEQRTGGNVRSPLVRANPAVDAADAAAYDIYTSPDTARYAGLPFDRHPWMSKLLELSHRVLSQGVVAELAELRTASRAFSNQDPEFVLECIPRFIEWYGLRHDPMYRDWKRDGNGDIAYGVVERRLQAGARVGVIGDWGTGLDDARELLVRLLRECKPSLLVHLGDVYYSGTPGEARVNFADVLEEAFLQVPPRLPVFSIPGNHDYYSGGRGFYEQLELMNQGPDRQPASYFCLRSEDGAWQIVGVDTGINDRVPGLPFDPFYTAPGLRPSEVEWLRNKLVGFPGRTILFSHHPLFSAHSALNGPRSGQRRLNFNEALAAAVEPHAERIALWMWGHEHSLAIYERNLSGIARCRLVGCSAFEMGLRDDPYVVKFDDAPLADPPVRLAIEQDWYDHGFAVIDLGPGTVEYYQFPSWFRTPPASPPPLTPLFTEEL